MLPEMFELPFTDYPVKSFGIMLMLGFFTAAYVAAKRAEKMRVDPDVVLNISIIALLGSMVGARTFFVTHYWERDFAHLDNPIAAMLDISRGGMELLGGVIGAFIPIMIYLAIKRFPIRLHLDILAPSLMIGLAFGRVGCFLNGCCWGGACAGTVAENWGVQFPYGSPAYVRQFEDRQVKVPAPLLTSIPIGENLPISRSLVNADPKKRGKYERLLAEAQERAAYFTKFAPDSKQAREALSKVESYERKAKQEQMEFSLLDRNLKRYPSKQFEGESITPWELRALAAQQHSRQVHPTQLYSSINALFASFFLYAVLRIRKRHGMVFAIWLMTYPCTRFIIELIRVDNPHDTFGLTVSQSISVAMFVCGVLMALWLRTQPLKSRNIEPWDPPEKKPQTATDEERSQSESLASAHGQGQ